MHEGEKRRIFKRFLFLFRKVGIASQSHPELEALAFFALTNGVRFLVGGKDEGRKGPINF